jgi:hypothetical protein
MWAPPTFVDTCAWMVFRHDRWVWHPEEVDMQTGLEEVMECGKPLAKRKGWKRIFMVIE